MQFLIMIFKKKNLVEMMGTGNLLIIQPPVIILLFTILVSVAFKIMVISFIFHPQLTWTDTQQKPCPNAPCRSSPLWLFQTRSASLHTPNTPSPQSVRGPQTSSCKPAVNTIGCCKVVKEPFMEALWAYEIYTNIEWFLDKGSKWTLSWKFFFWYFFFEI